MKKSGLLLTLVVMLSFSAQAAIRKVDLELYPQGIPGALDTRN